VRYWVLEERKPDCSWDGIRFWATECSFQELLDECEAAEGKIGLDCSLNDDRRLRIATIEEAAKIKELIRRCQE